MEKIAINKYRNVDNGSLRIEDAGKTVKLAGWVDTIRNFGELTFVVLRDTYGKTQIVLNKEFIPLSKEDVISVEGKVVERESKNKNMPTGDIEVVAESIVMLGKCSKELPFEIKNSEKVAEDIRLKYRYLDLRAEYNQKMLKLRSDLLLFVRNYMNEQNFVEVQTPILTASSPEGARDFLVPSRLNPGKFYALPQAPQQFKQLLMVSGIDRYFQIAPCFRDEDARADRSPTEFYQIDMEMAFATQEDVFEVIEGLYSAIFKKFANFEISEFKKIKYADAIRDYCTDKPDLRNPLKVVDVSAVFESTSFSVFQNKTIKAIKAATGGAKPRKWYDKLTDFLKSREAKGLAYFVVGENDELSAGVSKFVTEEEKAELKKLVGFETGDTVFFVADEEERAIKFTNVLRNELGKELELIDENDYKFCWIVDFPFFEKDEEGNIAFSHNPFSLPQSSLEEIKKDPFGTLAYQYDLVINGYESLSGAVRNHDQDMMVELFKLAGYGKEVVENKFPALYNAFSYGAPPHAGSAPGFDRLMMLLTHNEFIRDVYAFPMNKNAQDPLCNAPNTVDEKLLRDVHIKLIEE
ncbi:MAG: aspartate--tRNA ligase [Clostridia bacterium]|nr:aspartate--tRNA ligase [Clostridia bacterium]